MIRLQVTRNDFTKIAARLGTGAAALVKETGDAVAASAAQRSRVGTGAMRAGWEAKMVSPLRCEISNSQFYWRFNEYGTTKMGAQPMAHPAVESNRLAFYGSVGRLFAGGGLAASLI